MLRRSISTILSLSECGRTEARLYGYRESRKNGKPWGGACETGSSNFDDRGVQMRCLGFTVVGAICMAALFTGAPTDASAGDASGNSKGMTQGERDQNRARALRERSSWFASEGFMGRPSLTRN